MLESYESGVEYDFDPRNLPPAYLEAIGLATACPAQAEEAVLWTISALADVDIEYGIAIAAHMTAPHRDNVVRAIAEISLDDPDVLDQLDDILDKIKQAQDRRNRLVHHSWAKHPDGRVMLVSQKARGSVDVDVTFITVESIRDDATFIYEAGIELIGFLQSNCLLPKLPPQERSRAHKTKAARKKRRKDLQKSTQI